MLRAGYSTQIYNHRVNTQILTMYVFRLGGISMHAESNIQTPE